MFTAQAADTLSPVEYIGEHQANFSFRGPFQGREITWHCRLLTLRVHAIESGVGEARQFLEVSRGRLVDEFEIRIGLMLERIDAAAVARSIIMVRKYKRLAPGRHEYGEVYRFA